MQESELATFSKSLTKLGSSRQSVDMEEMVPTFVQYIGSFQMESTAAIVQCSMLAS